MAGATLWARSSPFPKPQLKLQLNRNLNLNRNRNPNRNLCRNLNLNLSIFVNSMPLLSALNNAVSGLQVFQQDLDVIGNNIANVNTTGFKSDRMDFQDTFNQALGGDTSVQVGAGVATAAVQSNFVGGTIASTGVGTDLAISGNGFFVVSDTSSGTAQQYLTRAGDFHVDGNGYLVTPGGLRVQGFAAGATSVSDLKIVPPTGSTATISSFSIDAFGNINAIMSDTTTSVLGQVALQNCADPNALTRHGDNLYSAPAAAGLLPQGKPQSSGLGSIKSSCLEMSNVDLSTEMTNLITAQRAFEANSKIVTTSDEVLQDLVNLKR
jgi:flagellar hook protein FlgE